MKREFEYIHNWGLAFPLIVKNCGWLQLLRGCNQTQYNYCIFSRQLQLNLKTVQFPLLHHCYRVSYI